jgi:hypothetical protein
MVEPCDRSGTDFKPCGIGRETVEMGRSQTGAAADEKPEEQRVLRSGGGDVAAHGRGLLTD